MPSRARVTGWPRLSTTTSPCSPFWLPSIISASSRSVPRSSTRCATGWRPSSCPREPSDSLPPRRCRTRSCATSSDTGSRRSAVPPLRCRATYRPFASASPAAGVLPYCLRRPAEGPVLRDLGPWRALPSRGGLTLTEDPRQTRRNGLDPRTAQSRSARSGGGSSRHVPPRLPCAPADVECERRADRRAHYRPVHAQNAPICARAGAFRSPAVTVQNGGYLRCFPGKGQSHSVRRSHPRRDSLVSASVDCL